jgi:hypothetical protein
VLLGNGDGTFTTRAAASGCVGNALTVGDFNGDGILDLAGSGAGYQFGIGIWYGKGDGTFSQGPSVTTTVGANVATIAADFNGDGATDLAASGLGILLGAPVLYSDLSVSVSHTGNFTQGQAGAAFTISVGSSGTAATSGAVTVVDNLPADLTATAISGNDWNCTLATLTCTRNDTLFPGSFYPGITVTVNVSGQAGSSVTNSVTASGGNAASGTVTASDPTSIGPGGGG